MTVIGAADMGIGARVRGSAKTCLPRGCSTACRGLPPLVPSPPLRGRGQGEGVRTLSPDGKSESAGYRFSTSPVPSPPQSRGRGGRKRLDTLQACRVRGSPAAEGPSRVGSFLLRGGRPADFFRSVPIVPIRSDSFKFVPIRSNSFCAFRFVHQTPPPKTHKRK